MEREEPAACLVNALIDEVGREESRRHGSSRVGAVNELVAVFAFALTRLLQALGIDLSLKGIVLLSIRHGAGIKPHVDQVALTIHGFALIVDEDDVVDIGSVEIYLVVVLLRVVAHDEAFVLERIALHHPGSDRFLNLVVELFHRSDALLSTILVAPNGQWRAPEA